MKKIYLMTILIFLSFLGACFSRDHVLRIGVAFHPASDILELIRDDLANEGITLDIRVFTHFSLANPALAFNEIDANFIQHIHFMNEFNQATNNDLYFAQGIYHAKLSLYSNVFSSIDEISYNSEIIMINDHINFARSLILLDQANLITLDDNTNVLANENNIIANPLNLSFRKVDQVTMAQVYHEQGRRLAIMYPTFARMIDPTNNLIDEIIFAEELTDFTKSYAIGIAINHQNKNNPNILTLLELLNSSKVSDWIIQNYAWAAIPY